MVELNTSHIARQELDVQSLTKRNLAGFCKYFNQAIDLLIKLQYRAPKIQDVNTEGGAYLSSVSYWLYMSIYTFRACFVLIERGHYAEAYMLSRNLIEILVKMRYFEGHKDKMKNFQLTKGRSITWKTMFDSVIPGFYAEQYGPMLSEITHGGIGSLLFKVDVKSPTEAYPDTGIVFKEKMATLVINNVNNFLLGFIKFYKHLYPEVIIRLDKDYPNEFSKVVKILEDCFNEHITLKGGENKWHKVSRQIWDFE